MARFLLACWGDNGGGQKFLKCCSGKNPEMAYWERHAALGLIRLGKWETLDLASQVVASATATYERALGSVASGFFQVTLAQTPFRETGIRDLERTPIQWTLGFKRLVWNRQALFVGFSDTIGSFNNSADVGFHVGITMIFD